MQAEQFIKTNSKQAKEFLQVQFGYNPVYIDYIWRSHDFVVELSQAMLVAFEDQARWRINNKLSHAKQIPNYLDYIYLDALEAIKPQAVTIIH